MKHLFQIQLPQRSASLEIIETISEVYVNLWFSKYGDFNDLQLVTDWMLPIFSRYENDKRPVVVTSPSSNLTGVIEGSGDNCISYLIGR